VAAPRRFFRVPRSLRGRLLSASLILVAVGLIAAGVTTFGALNSFLVSRVDDQLHSSVFAADQALDSANGTGPGLPPGGFSQGIFQPPNGSFAEFLSPSGTRLGRAVTFDYQRAAGPEIPAGLPGSATGPADGERLFTAAPAGSPFVTYRVLARPLADGAGTFVVAIPLGEVAGTLHRLLLVEIVAIVAVLLLMAGLALWLVGLGLRPLQRIEETAGAIAAGDLSRRVEPAEPSTEVGRLGLALNAMLGQIEEAFAERTASEDRLRRFVSDASHELRTPLTSIRGYAELFRRGAADRPVDLAKAMGRIEAEAARMGVLVEDLLLLARMDEGVFALNEARIDLTSVASRAVEDARAVDPDRPIDLRTNGSVFVLGDEGRLKQVLDNLLANARVHTPPGTPTRVTVAAGAEATVEVADDGPGVDGGVRDRIFERFYRADASRSREKGGAGLGLAIASEIARAHGGSLTLSPAERGAAFVLTLPLSDAA
jgi:two-component system OmpR family sensor kinase